MSAEVYAGHNMLDIRPIHAFSDNFIWLLRDEGGQRCAVVDPGDAAPVIAQLESEGLTLSEILITHKHGDHIGGIRALKARFPNATVYGPVGEPIPELRYALHEGNEIDLDSIGTSFTVMDVPGHTEGHIAYVGRSADRPVLFCGDTLFSIGCGRVFSGSFEQLHDSLMRIRELSDDTLVYCAHEYTLDNIGFARWVEPDNPALLARAEQAHAQIDAGDDTVPSRLGDEKAANPFLRIDEPGVIAAAERHAGRAMRDSRDSFHTIRRWKDTEYD
jgi:hydroxyacylglutathione hydrolase